MCETERRSLFRPVHVRTYVGASAEHLWQDAEKKQCPSEDLALKSAFGHSPKQANASEHERTCGTGTLEEDRRNMKILR